MPGKSFYIVRKLIYFCNFKKVTGFVLRPGRDDRIDNTRGNCMKKILSVITLTVLIASCGQDRKARVQGSFSGLSHDTVLLEMVTTQGRRIVDSTVIDQGGDFRFRVKLPEKGPVFYNLLCDGSAIPLIVTPGDRIEVNSLCDLARNYTVEGSEESQLLKQFNTQYGNGVATLDSLSKIYRNTPVVADTEKRQETCWISTWRSITGSSASTSLSLWPILRRWLPFMRCTNGCRTTRGCSMKKPI